MLALHTNTNQVHIRTTGMTLCAFEGYAERIRRHYQTRDSFYSAVF